MTALIINGIALSALLLSFRKDRRKTGAAMKAAVRTGIGLLPFTLFVVGLIGILNALVPLELVSRWIGEQAGFAGVLSAALLGSILHIPALIAFPLSSSMISMGASVSAVAAFLLTLTMIGFITLPVEIEMLGKKMALLRNGLSFLAAVVIASIMGVVW